MGSPATMPQTVPVPKVTAVVEAEPRPSTAVGKGGEKNRMIKMKMKGKEKGRREEGEIVIWEMNASSSSFEREK